MSNFKTTDSQIYTNYLTGVEHGNQVEGNLAAAEGLFEDDRTLHEIEVLKKMLAPGYYETFVRKRMTENRDVLNESFFGELDDSLRKLRQAQLSALAEAMKLELRSTGLFTKLWSWIIA